MGYDSNCIVPSGHAVRACRLGRTAPWQRRPLPESRIMPTAPLSPDTTPLGFSLNPTARNYILKRAERQAEIRFSRSEVCHPDPERRRCEKIQNLFTTEYPSTSSGQAAEDAEGIYIHYFSRPRSPVYLRVLCLLCGKRFFHTFFAPGGDDKPRGKSKFKIQKLFALPFGRREFHVFQSGFGKGIGIRRGASCLLRRGGLSTMRAGARESHLPL